MVKNIVYKLWNWERRSEINYKVSDVPLILRNTWTITMIITSTYAYRKMTD